MVSLFGGYIRRPHRIANIEQRFPTICQKGRRLAMDSNIIVALIGAIATIIAAVITAVYQHNQRVERKEDARSEESLKKTVPGQASSAKTEYQQPQGAETTRMHANA